MKTKKHIVIVGAGFGGLQTAISLSKRMGTLVDITLVDKHDYHLFSPNLYEVATSGEDLTNLSELRQHIVVPISRIISGTHIRFVQAEVESVNQKAREVGLGVKILPYTTLVIALGSVNDDHGTLGASEFAMPLKTLSDVFRIRNAIEFAFQAHRQDPVKKLIRIVVAGGGYTGVEFITELASAVPFLAWKNSIPRHKIELEIIDSENVLIPGLNEKLSKDAKFRMQELGIRVRLNEKITRVDRQFVEYKSGERETYDVLVWAAGVKAYNLSFANPVVLGKQGRLVVNEYLQLKEHPEIYAVGDMAAVLNCDGQLAQCSVPDAWEQGGYVAYAIECAYYNRRPRIYHSKPHGFIVTLGGKWAIATNKYVYLKGMVGYIVRLFVHMRYYARILGFFTAIKQIYGQADVFGKNDL